MSDKYAKTLKLLATVTPALDNNTQGQAAAGILLFLVIPANSEIQ
jgi:hypothetical protein